MRAATFHWEALQNHQVRVSWRWLPGHLYPARVSPWACLLCILNCTYIWLQVANTVWALSSPGGANSPKVDLEHLQKLFSMEVTPPKPGTSGTGGNGKKKKARKELLDMRRANNIAVVLRQVQMDHSTLCNAILRADSAKLGADAIEGLLRIVPKKAEVETVNKYVVANRPEPPPTTEKVKGERKDVAAVAAPGGNLKLSKTPEEAVGKRKLELEGLPGFKLKQAAKDACVPPVKLGEPPRSSEETVALILEHESKSKIVEREELQALQLPPELTEAESFVALVGPIRTLERKLFYMQLRLDFEPRASHLMATIEAVSAACIEMQVSPLCPHRPLCLDRSHAF